MKENLEIIAKNYIETKLVKNTNKTMIYRSMKNLENILSSYIPNNYEVTFSTGKGNWAFVPWIAIFDTTITKSATEGYYIAYLFSADMKRLYLSLHQGFTYYKEKLGNNAYPTVSELSSIWRNQLFIEDNTPLNLANNSALPKGYTVANITSICYDTHNIPHTEVLKNDLNKMMFQYKKMKEIMIENSFIKTNNMLLANYRTQENTLPKKSDPLDEIISLCGLDCKLIYVNEFPDSIIFDAGEDDDNDTITTNRSTNYEKKSRRDKEIGLAGEYFVLQSEINKLNNLKIKKKVIHQSVVTKDKERYDILSYNENKDEMHIEVKTTTSGINTPFYISKRELSYSRKHPDQYYLYRVYDLDINSKTGKLYFIHGDLSKVMKMEPHIYKVNGMLKK